MQYRPEIDGLRAVAVLPVILFHAGFDSFGGGFVGVDVFFVISGYLIASILLSDIARGDLSVLAFYERRARRILPALFVVSIASMPVAAAVMLPSEMKDFSGSLASVALFVSNFFFMSQVSYFAADAEVQPLLHTWSLAVEEQFYLLFPLVLWGLRGFTSRRIALVLGVLAVASFGLAEAGVQLAADRNFFFSPSRFWELLAGAICAIFLLNREPLAKNALAGLGLGMILAAVFLFDRTVPFPGHNALLPVIGTVLIILFAHPNTTTARLLTMRPLVFVGLISYSAYLWHQPIFAFARLGRLEPLSDLQMLGLACLTLALAAVTWRLVEQPFRSRRFPLLPRRRDVFAGSLVGGLLLFGFGAAGHVSNGFERIWRQMNPGQIQALDLVIAAQDRGTGRVSKDCHLALMTLDDKELAQIAACRKLHGQAILIIGDSHAIDLFGLVAETSGAPFVVGVTSGGCRPHTPQPDCLYPQILDLAAALTGTFEFAIYEQAGFYLLTSESYPEGNRRMFSGLALDERVPEFGVNAVNRDAVESYLTDLSAFVPVVWLAPRLEPHIPLEVVLRQGCAAGHPIRDGLAQTFHALELDLTLTLRDSPVAVLSQNTLFKFEFPRDFGDCDGLLWRDGDHFSALGQKVFGERGDVIAAARSALMRP